MTAISIVEFDTESDYRRAFPLMRELYWHLDEPLYLRRLLAMKNEGYRLFALVIDERVVALAGFELLNDFYLGKHLWLRDLVTAAAERSKGYGKVMMEYIEELAYREGCEKVALLSGLRRMDAHHFYEEHCAYHRLAYVFEKELDEDVLT
jgi:GNAT superfamily N-acetyltransferase